MPRRHSILVVDDEARIRKSLSGLLEDNGYEVRTAGSGVECLQLMSSGRFDLVILDIVMPEMNGIETLKTIKERHQTEVVMISAYADKEKAIAALRLKAYDFVEKPCESKEILNTVAHCLRQQELKKEIERKSRELGDLKQMLDEITQGITESILLLSKDYRVLWANKAALRQTGLSMDELIGNFCYMATHIQDYPCEPPNDPCPISELLRTGNPVILEHAHYDRDGNRIFVEVSAYPIKNASGEVARFVHISKDISLRKSLEQEREKLIRELQDALEKVKTLSGLLPICASCKKIRNDEGNWDQIEAYIRDRTDAVFSHGLCPECAKRLYPEYRKEVLGKEDT